MAITPINYKPGYQGSTKSYAVVTIYQHGNDPIIVLPKQDDKLPFDGRRESDKNPSLISVNTNKDINSASGSFNIGVKPSRAAETLFSRLVDDDWIDIVFYENGIGYHVMRGLVDEIRESKTVTANGATTRTFQISGRDFGKIWEQTPIWFSPTAMDDFVTECVANQAFEGAPGELGNPAQAAFHYMQKFLEATAESKGPNWMPPKSIPGTKLYEFTGSLKFQDKYFQNRPQRIVIDPATLNPNGTLWDLAKQYSDPMFTEMYVDMLPEGDPYSGELTDYNALSPENSKMTVVIRDKPFPTIVPPDSFYIVPWKYVPTFTVQRQELKELNTGRSGYERYNAYYMSTALATEALQSEALFAQGALVDLEDIKRHGIRRMDVQTSFHPDPASITNNFDFVALVKEMRKRIRDWYCLNPYLLSGTALTGHGRPDIKIGCRMRIPGAETKPSQNTDETYYIESVGNSWSFGTSTKTTLGITRGWVGTDRSYLEARNTMAGKYTVPAPEVAGEEEPVTEADFEGEYKRDVPDDGSVVT